jgi:hypothetical protein
MSDVEEQLTIHAKVIMPETVDPNQVFGEIALYDADGNPVDIPALTAFMNMFDLTGAEDGYILAFDATVGKYRPLPLSSGA